MRATRTKDCTDTLLKYKGRLAEMQAGLFFVSGTFSVIRYSSVGNYMDISDPKGFTKLLKAGITEYLNSYNIP